MSKYGEFTTTLTDPGHLSGGLQAMGFEIECHLEPQTLYDYHGRPRPEKANIIIRRFRTGIDASNDIGFVRDADGTYRAIISDYDRGAKFDESWMGELKQSYAEHRTIAMAKQKGYIFQGREVVQTTKGKQVRLQFQAR